MISAKIIQHSNSWLGVPLVTYVLEYPRYIHSELLTHRVFSKNSASSRAIPLKRFMEMVESNPSKPLWTANQKGMQGPVITDSDIINNANLIWSEAAEDMTYYAERLDALGIHKQNINRLLEPWMHIKIVLTGTDFDNWFELRDHQKAHPEIRELARMMRLAMDQSNPQMLAPGQWHLPFVQSPFPVPEGLDMMSTVMKVSAARCARVSYNNFDGTSDISKDIELFNKLFSEVPRHCSPAEHQAQVPQYHDLYHMSTGWDTRAPKGELPSYSIGKYFSNLRGWIQLRKLIECNEFA